MKVKLKIFNFSTIFMIVKMVKILLNCSHDWNSVKFRTHHGPSWPGLNIVLWAWDQWVWIKHDCIILYFRKVQKVVAAPVERQTAELVFKLVEFIKMQYQGQSVLCKIALYFLAWPLFELVKDPREVVWVWSCPKSVAVSSNLECPWPGSTQAMAGRT